MIKTERILVKPSHENYKYCKNLVKKDKIIYNIANYIMRQSFFDGDFLSWVKVDKIVKFKFPNQYNSIPNHAAQSVIKKLGDDWKSFFEALKSYKINPSLFKKRPKPPRYSKKYKTYIHPFQSLNCIDSHIIFPKKTNLSPIKIKCCKEQRVFNKLIPLKVKKIKKGSSDDLRKAILKENQEILKENKKREKKNVKLKEESIKNKIINEIRIVPQGHVFWLEIVYNDKQEQSDVFLDKNNVIGIDLGVNNLLTIVSNVDSLRPILVNGKTIKSINQQYNKKKAFFQEKNNTTMVEKLGVNRFCQINDIFHKMSHFVINYCVKNDIGKIVVGKNEQWKTSINIGKVNNQKFVSIPYNKLIAQLKYKAKHYNIDVEEQEESYTSKSDSLALDHLPIYDKDFKGTHKFKGKRTKRGLYQSSIGKLLNADVNGAINILRKVIGDDFVKNLVNKGFVFNPVSWCVAPTN